MPHYIETSPGNIETFEDAHLPDRCIISYIDESIGYDARVYGEKEGVFVCNGDDKMFPVFERLKDVRIESIRDKEGNFTHCPEWMAKKIDIHRFISIQAAESPFNDIEASDYEKVLVWRII